jgi:glycopeptide antibiotics resistance protein
LSITVGALAYEFIPLSSNRTFDIKDVVATLLGAIIAFVVFNFLELKNRISNP